METETSPHPAAAPAEAPPKPTGKVLPVIKYGHPTLRAKGRPVGEVDEETRQLAADMLATMYAAQGVGLAAQQVGVAKQLTVLDTSVVNQEERPSGMFLAGEPVNPNDWMPMMLLNPRVEPVDEARETASEGCLSFPEIHGEVRRAARIRVAGRLLDGREVEFEATGLLSRALQHETDHLQGVLFIDRMSRATRVGLAGRLKRLQRESEDR